MPKVAELGFNMNFKIKFDEPLNDLDTEKQTFGCRQNNPDICGKNGLPNLCAFVRKDGICKSPSSHWAKQYSSLSKQESQAGSYGERGI
jgi:hypothetical protein